jgi:hypothetical protein
MTLKITIICIDDVFLDNAFLVYILPNKVLPKLECININGDLWLK